MKTLINKQNPKIRITAPEITLENHCYCLYTDDGDCIIEFWEKDWTLVVEESKTKRKQSPALKKIVDNLTEEKLAKTRAEMKIAEEEPEKVNCPFDKGDCRYCTVQFCGAREQNRVETRSTAEPVDLEKLALEKYPIQMAYLEGLKKGYELGLNARKEE